VVIKFYEVGVHLQSLMCTEFEREFGNLHNRHAILVDMAAMAQLMDRNCGLIYVGKFQRSLNMSGKVSSYPHSIPQHQSLSVSAH